jgi:hypothetical protein
MTDNDTMRQFIESEGYNFDETVNPCNVKDSDLTEDSRVLAYTSVPNYGDGPATTYDLVEFEIESVVPAEELEEYSDGAASFPEDTPVPLWVHFAYRGDIPQGVSVGYGESLYGEESDFDDPHRGDRLRSHVLGRSDTYVRFLL